MPLEGTRDSLGLDDQTRSCLGVTLSMWADRREGMGGAEADGQEGGRSRW
jgi:hypothetical protein